jgi:hypothetical protein
MILYNKYQTGAKLLNLQGEQLIALANKLKLDQTNAQVPAIQDNTSSLVKPLPNYMVVEPTSAAPKHTMAAPNGYNTPKKTRFEKNVAQPIANVADNIQRTMWQAAYPISAYKGGVTKDGPKSAGLLESLNPIASIAESSKSWADFAQGKADVNDYANMAGSAADVFMLGKLGDIAQKSYGIDPADWNNFLKGGSESVTISSSTQNAINGAGPLTTADAFELPIDMSKRPPTKEEQLTSSIGKIFDDLYESDAPFFREYFAAHTGTTAADKAIAVHNYAISPLKLELKSVPKKFTAISDAAISEEFSSLLSKYTPKTSSELPFGSNEYNGSFVFGGLANKSKNLFSIVKRNPVYAAPTANTLQNLQELSKTYPGLVPVQAEAELIPNAAVSEDIRKLISELYPRIKSEHSVSFYVQNLADGLTMEQLRNSRVPVRRLLTREGIQEAIETIAASQDRIGLDFHGENWMLDPRTGKFSFFDVMNPGAHTALNNYEDFKDQLIRTMTYNDLKNRELLVQDMPTQFDIEKARNINRSYLRSLGLKSSTIGLILSKLFSETTTEQSMERKKGGILLYQRGGGFKVTPQPVDKTYDGMDKAYKKAISVKPQHFTMQNPVMPQDQTAIPLTGFPAEKHVDEVAQPEEFDLKKHMYALSGVESSFGKNLYNPNTSATGHYQFLFNLIKDTTLVSGKTREEFANDKELQDKLFEEIFNNGVRKERSTKDSIEMIKRDYADMVKIHGFDDYSIAALIHFLGRQGTRQYMGYHLKKKMPLKESNPGLYKNGVLINHTPDEYILKYKKYLEEASSL